VFLILRVDLLESMGSHTSNSSYSGGVDEKITVYEVSPGKKQETVSEK
jgi:hypothetical protein